MKKLQFIVVTALVVSLAACGTQKKSENQSADSSAATGVITDRKWRLVELSGKSVPATVNGKEAFIQLNKADSSYTAFGGCNGMGGSFEVTGNWRIKFTQGMSTMMACDNMEIENGLKQTFGNADNYTIKGDSLSLNKARMAPLARFIAVK
ncbi:MAG: META domain-containing protein [Pedobacter sp.]|nr:MAG: META domain-containing protein [Pedobacter sp.]